MLQWRPWCLDGRLRGTYHRGTKQHKRWTAAVQIPSAPPPSSGARGRGRGRGGRRACGGGGGSGAPGQGSAPGDDPAGRSCDGFCADAGAPIFLTQADVKRILAQAVHQADALGAEQVPVAVVDRVGNVLAIHQKGGGQILRVTTDDPNEVRAALDGLVMGIGFTLVGVQKGYRVIIIMPENMSEERKKIIISCDNPNKSLNLSKTLATSLCRIHDF